MLAAQWERGYAALRAYVEREGHADVPDRHREGELQLGRWLQTQRKRKQARERSEEERKAKTKASALSDDEMSRLESLGVVWRVRRKQ